MKVPRLLPGFLEDAPMGFWVVSFYVLGVCFFLPWAVIAAVVPLYWQVYGRRFLFGEGRR